MCDLLERARENQGNISYYEVAKRLNVSSAHMNKWKKDLSKPNGLHTLRLAQMAGVSYEEAIELVIGKISESEKQKGLADIGFLLFSSVAYGFLYLTLDYSHLIHYAK